MLRSVFMFGQARLWVQIMRELRHGVKLKKVEHVHLPPVEYELTPYEVLMEDIRSRRYTLNKIMVSIHGQGVIRKHCQKSVPL